MGLISRVSSRTYSKCGEMSKQLLLRSTIRQPTTLIPVTNFGTRDDQVTSSSSLLPVPFSPFPHQFPITFISTTRPTFQSPEDIKQKSDRANIDYLYKFH